MMKEIFKNVPSHQENIDFTYWNLSVLIMT